ncbi:hypothetical protein BH10PAT2_BH10PAT2_2040 [soil metagenome]
MKNSHFFTSFLYSVGEIGLGLLLHPYQTMQSLQQEKIFAWMTLFPTVALAIVTVFWRFGVVPLARIFFSCNPAYVSCFGVTFFSDWLTFFCIYWQVLLLYLFFRFSRVLSKNA